MNLLQEGDIVELREGHVVYLTLPQHFCYSNAFGNFVDTATATVSIGDNVEGLDTGFLAGRYVVVSAGMQGGGVAMGNDVYDDGWYVTCQRLMPTGISTKEPTMSAEHPLRVSFYQSGSFTAMNQDITPIGRALATWHEAPK